MLILGKVRLGLPHRVRKEILLGPAGLEPPVGARIRKKSLS